MDCEPKWALTWALRNDANYYQEQTMTRRNKATTSGSPRDVDSYLAVVPAEARAALEKLRKRWAPSASGRTNRFLTRSCGN
jgi:hypothetical protein